MLDYDDDNDGDGDDDDTLATPTTIFSVIADDDADDSMADKLF